MGLTTTLARWLGTTTPKTDAAKESKTSRSAPLTVHLGTPGQPRATPRAYDRLAEEGFRRNVVAYRCVRLIAQNAASVPWTLSEFTGAQPARLHDHPLLALLARPNPLQGGTELFDHLYASFLIAGNAYLEAVGPEQGLPRELWVLRPDRLRVVPGTSGLPQAYRYQAGGRTIDFAVDGQTGRAPVLHLKSFHPLDDWYGLSPLEAAAFSIDQHNAAGTWNAALLQQSGRPSGALVYRPSSNGQDQLTSDQRQNLKNELEAFFSGAANAGRPMVLEGGLDWKEMALSPKDMDWLAGKDMSAREIALAFNVPPQLIGLEGSLTFANFEQARLALYDDAVLPLLVHVRDALNNWLGPAFGENLRLDFNKDAIEALSPRREKIWNRLAGASFLTPNEKRRELGLEALPGGDRLDSTEKAGL